MLLIVKLFKLPWLIKCGPPAGNVSSLHLPDPGDCLCRSLSPSSASSHSCIVVWSVVITQFELYIMHTYTTVKKISTHFGKYIRYISTC